MSGQRMTVSLVGQCRNAARQLTELGKAVGDHRRVDHQADYYAFALTELADHAQGVRDGKYTLAEFAEFYGLVEKAKAATSA